ncbi:response regulator transcription factor [Bacillus changyiensis]|uniref:response regulator transcription factor n=1 Tax=Bacillus changyiensis TaxID=3004103 RepID=UPI0022E2A355|nr:helix-turn-helix domain-containing protein [Bacillus changyiensis]MDA1475372.1 helix-turn-helix domain-containing protein [Bacillus changyiensis]
MYRVLIIDHHPDIRERMISLIDWGMEGLKAQYQSVNGKAARNTLETCSFNILITDVELPIIDGIELIKYALYCNPRLKVILISHDRDFAYVKAMDGIGGVDYLLKRTLKKEDFLSVLRQCVDQIEKEQREECEWIEYQKCARYWERKQIEKEIKRLLVSEQRSFLQPASVPIWLESQYACVYLILDQAEKWKDTHGGMYVQFLLEDLQEMFYKQIMTGFGMIVGQNSMFFVLPANKIKHELNQWKVSVEEKWNISLSKGITFEQGIGNMSKGYVSSKSACQKQFFKGLYSFYNMDRSNTAFKNDFTAKKKGNEWAIFYDMIYQGEPVAKAIESIYERWKGETFNLEQVQHEACHLLVSISGFFGHSDILLSEEQDRLKQVKTLEQLIILFSCYLEKITIPFIPQYEGRIMMKALDFISSNYRENLTLQSVAKHVHLSKSYFSLFFKKQTGRNFIDYLIDLRIREAKRLLTETERWIYEVAKSSGFKDVKYFSKAFKKIAGLTPYEYRKRYKKKDRINGAI